MSKPDTPNLDRMAAVRDQSQAIGEFLEWLQGRGYVICEKTSDLYPFFPTLKSIEELLADYFEVDLREAEREREALLRYILSQELGGEEQMKNIDRIFTDGVLIDLDIGYWSGQKRLRPEDLELSEVPEIYSLGKKYLVFKEVINRFRRLEKRARRYVDMHSFAFPVGSTRFVPRRAAIELLPKLDEMKDEFYREVDNFVANYDVVRQETLKTYSAYRKHLEPYYPSAAEVRAKFHFDYHLYTISAPSIDRVSSVELAAEEEVYRKYVREYDEKLRREFDGFIDSVVKQLRARAADLCSRIAAKVRNGEVVTKQSYDALRRLVDEYSLLNFVGDREVEARLQEIKKRFLGQNVPEGDMEEFTKALDGVVEAAANVTDISKVTGTYKRRLKVA